MLYYSSFLIAMFAVIIMIPPLTYAYQKLGLFDMPSPRKVHSTPVPRVGGIAIVVASVIPIIAWIHFDAPLMGMLVGIGILFLLGIVDDIRNLNYKIKFLVQIAAIFFVFQFGFIDTKEAYYVTSGFLSALVFVSIHSFFILGVTNAINLADGLDGLAGGEALLSFSIIALLAYESTNILVLTIVLAVMGAVFGFLRFNTYPARIFMGDTGSLFLGFLLGLLSIALTYSESNAYAKTLPVLLVGLPVFDTLMVIFIRLAKGKSPFTADRNHLHHRLMDNGLKHYQSVLVIYMVQALFVLSAFFMRYQLDQEIIIAFIVLSLLAVLLGFIPWGWISSREGRIAIFLNVKKYVERNSDFLFSLLSGLLIMYVVIASFVTERLGWDVRGMLMAVFVIGAVYIIIRKSKPCGWVERVAIHVMIVLSVYISAMYEGMNIGYINNLHTFIMVMCFVLVGIMLLAQHKQRFVGSPLDFLLIALALVVPNLPGSPISDPKLSFLALKLIALFYFVEFVLFNLNSRWWLVRLTLVSCAGIPLITSMMS